MMKNLEAYLDFNFSFSREEIERILDCFKSKVIKKKEFFLREGQQCRNVGFVEQGTFLYYQIIEGEDRVCDFGFENDWITQYSSLLGGVPSEVSIVALEDSEVMYMDMVKMEALNAALPKVNTIRS